MSFSFKSFSVSKTLHSVGSIGTGRRPQAHWVTLFSIFFTLIVAAVGWSAYVFFGSLSLETGVVDEDAAPTRSFDKRQFERILEHYAEHDSVLQKVRNSNEILVEPS